MRTLLAAMLALALPAGAHAESADIDGGNGFIPPPKDAASDPVPPLPDAGDDAGGVVAPDAGGADVSFPGDAGDTMDAAFADVGTFDTGLHPDATTDTGPRDTGPRDTGPTDAPPRDATADANTGNLTEQPAECGCTSAQAREERATSGLLALLLLALAATPRRRRGQ